MIAAKTEQSFSRVLAGTALIFMVVLLAYVPAMKAGFIWDDDTMLIGNSILQPNGLFKAWFTTETLNYWPVTSTSFWLEHKLWGLNPAGYHLVNILLHAGCAVLIWRILIRLGIPAALPSALIFAVHPVNVETVAWVTQRKTLLAMLFFLASLVLYLRFDESRKRRVFLWSVLFFALAVLSKGSVMALPVVILLCVWWLRGRVQRLDVVRSLPYFGIAAIMSAVEIWFQYSRAGADVVRTDSFSGRLAGAGTAVWFYLFKALVPASLTFVYPRWRIDPAQVASWFPDLALMAVFGLGWRFRRSWGRPVLFAFGYTVLMLSPMLGFFNIYFMRYSLVADHYQYASIIGIIALVAAASTHWPRGGVLPHSNDRLQG